MTKSIYDIDGPYHHLLIGHCKDILRQPKYAGFLRMYKNFNKDFIQKMNIIYIYRLSEKLYLFLNGL